MQCQCQRVYFTSFNKVESIAAYKEKNDIALLAMPFSL